MSSFVNSGSETFTGKDITVETAVNTWTNNTGIDLVVQVKMAFSSLNNDNTKTLTCTLCDNSGTKRMLNASFTDTKIASTAMSFIHPYSVPLKNGEIIGMKVLSNDAGNDTAVDGEMRVFALNVVDVFSVGYATPASATLLDKASRIRANKGIQYKDDGHMIIRNDDDTDDLYQINYTNTDSDLSRELTVL